MDLQGVMREIEEHERESGRPLSRVIVSREDFEHIRRELAAQWPEALLSETLIIHHASSKCHIQTAAQAVEIDRKKRGLE